MINFLLGATDTNYQSIESALLNFFNNYIIPASLTVAVCVFAIRGVILGIKLAKTSATEEESTKTKKSLVMMIVGAAVCFIAIWIVPYLFNLLGTAFGIQPITNPTANG